MNRLNQHLQEVDESYLQHMWHALSFAGNLALASVVCTVHAFFPFLLEKQGSSIVHRMYERMVKNRQNLSNSKKKQQHQDLLSTG
ncbi:MAG: DUF6356 family protein [Gammaproteobacteria bacterium]|nr:DUF6356 family protein [Gammaproteobacteria bacterium]MCY4358771.1 DUF6356 family protein [Gammaproteobacteria bacterium]